MKLGKLQIVWCSWWRVRKPSIRHREWWGYFKDPHWTGTVSHFYLNLGPITISWED